jgi:hypothetical protein
MVRLNGMPDPNVHTHHGNEGQRRTGEPRDTGIDDAEVTQETVQRATVLIQDPAPHSTGNDQGKEPREQEQGPQYSVEGELALEEDGQRQPDHELANNGADGEQDGVQQ